MKPHPLDANERIESPALNGSRRNTRPPLALLSLLCITLCGCDSHVTHADITDSTGNNRLVIIDRKINSITDWLQHRQSYDFDSLAWQTNVSGDWHDRLTISSRAFQGTNSHLRWVSDIYNIDPTNGTAIIKVAEGDAPEGSPHVNYIYSWRQWSLLTNNQVRLIRVCAVPFEKFN